VYDVTRRETFTNLVGTWAKEVGLYSTNHDCIKILVGNKVDKVNIMVYGLAFTTYSGKDRKPYGLCFSPSYYLITYLKS